MQSKNRSYYAERAKADRRRRQMIRNWIILGAVVVLAVTALLVFNRSRDTTEMTATRLICLAEQDVTPFGDNLLYYDGASVHCLAANGSVRWSYPVGTGASFYAGSTHVIIWVGSQVYIVDSAGRPTYNEAMSSDIQFARVCSHYAAVVIGTETRPDLIIRDLNGVSVDEEYEDFSGMILLDLGFYGDNDQYMWALSLDVYGTAINSVLNTYQVGKMNTGEASVGEKLAYKVIFADNKLRVFTTQQLYTYDYKAVVDTNAAMLVYGWEAVDSFIPNRGSANFLLVPNGQNIGSMEISQLRVLSGSDDRRYTLPTGCIGAMVDDRSVYAFSTDYIYRSDITNPRFYAYEMPLPDGSEVTAYLGKLTGGTVLLASDNTVYAVTLPK